MQVHILIENKSEKRFRILVKGPNYNTTQVGNGKFGSVRRVHRKNLPNALLRACRPIICVRLEFSIKEMTFCAAHLRFTAQLAVVSPIKTCKKRGKRMLLFFYCNCSDIYIYIYIKSLCINFIVKS